MNRRNEFVLHLSVITTIMISGCAGSGTAYPPRSDGPVVIVYQPSHQTDTGVDFSEAAVCNAIAEGALQAHTDAVRASKVWSHDVPRLRYARQGSNTKVDHTSAVVGDSLTGYAWELKESNGRTPHIFISIHNNGATNRHAIWGFIHEGDVYEPANRELAAQLVAAIADATGLENRGVLLDSSTGRNDYRCFTTGHRAFYSLDENVNMAPYRVLLEIGDNAVSREFLMDPANQKKMGQIIAGVLEGRFTR
jgi:hypothetical protein